MQNVLVLTTQEMKYYYIIIKIDNYPIKCNPYFQIHYA